MAPTSPANTTPIESTSCTTTSLAMVVATWVPKTRKAAKLKNAAQATAARGESTLVETTVAIEFAASWNPLTKSNASATRMTMTRPADIGVRSGVLQDDCFDDVRDVLDRVERQLHRLDDVLPAQHLEGVEL